MPLVLSYLGEEKMLKSDQDGIEIRSSCLFSYLAAWLKSDQDGIEIHPWGIRVAKLRLLKSDQDGIEIASRDARQHQGVPLKSDQDGIEIGMESSGALLRKFSWNQTKMGLKYVLFFQRSECFFCWNQTKMGLKLFHYYCYLAVGKVSLKSDQDGIEIFVCDVSECISEFVEIRPRWDWNLIFLRRRLNSGDVEIRPRWDWNQALTKLALLKNGGLKSDQDGIEIFEKWRRMARDWEGWNQTKMGLK